MPLADGAKASLQTEVNRIYDMFVQSVARNRNCSASYVAATDAGLFFGPDAVTAGLADGVASCAEVIAQLTQLISKPPTAMTVLPSLTKEISMKEDTPEPLAQAPQPIPIEQAATGATYDQAVEIAQLCALAGMPDKTAELLSSGQTVSQVRQALLTAKAAVPTISGHASPIHNPQRNDLLVNLIKQRVSKES